MVKNKKLSKSSIAIIVLAVLLIASLVMGMTGAWFTSRPPQKSTGNLKFGKVELEVAVAPEDVETQGWSYTKDETGHAYLSTTDLMPGDTVEGHFTLNNLGDAAYVFMVYGGTVVREFADAEDALALKDAIEAQTGADHAEKLAAWEALSEANQTAAIATAKSALETAYNAGSGVDYEALMARLNENLFEVLANIADADHNTAGNQPAVTVPNDWTGFANYGEEVGETARDGYVRYKGADVQYSLLQKADADAVTDTKAVAFQVILDGEVFGDDYQNATIEIHVEFVAVQAANLSPDQAVAVAFGLANLQTQTKVVLDPNNA